MRRVLLLGAGSSHERRIPILGRKDWSDSELVTLDFNGDHDPDVVADLEVLPYAWAEDNSFDEIHAYEVLEHTGKQGDWRFFFAQFTELHRMLKPGGFLAATCPSYRSPWAWGDPSHTRVLTSGTLAFLSQDEYRRQVGKTAMSDFRFCYKADFLIHAVREDEHALAFVLKAVK